MTQKTAQPSDSNIIKQQLTEYEIRITSIFAVYVGRPIKNSGFMNHETNKYTLEIVYHGPPLNSEKIEAFQRGIDRAVMYPLRVENPLGLSASSILVHLPVDDQGNLLSYADKPTINTSNPLALIDLFDNQPTPLPSE